MLTKTEKLKQLLNILNDGITQAEFVKSFKSVIEHILKLEKKLIERVDGKTATEEEALKKLNEDFNKVISQAKKESDSTFSGIKRRIFETITTLFAKSQIKDKVDDKIKEVDEKLSQIRNGVDANEDRVSIIASERAIETIKPLIPTIDTPEQIADKLEALKDDNRLKIKAIKGLEEKLAELENRPLGGKGGGMTDFGVKMSMNRMVKTEVPSGLINSTNKVYTVTGKISAILSFGINGQIIHSDEYSFTNRTITFITALPTELSATRFEIIYI